MTWRYSREGFPLIYNTVVYSVGQSKSIIYFVISVQVSADGRPLNYCRCAHVARVLSLFRYYYYYFDRDLFNIFVMFRYLILYKTRCLRSVCHRSRLSSYRCALKPCSWWYRHDWRTPPLFRTFSSERHYYGRETSEKMIRTEYRIPKIARSFFLISHFFFCFLRLYYVSIIIKITVVLLSTATCI